MIKNGLYKMSDFEKQTAEFMVKETDKTIIFELIGEIPHFTKGDMDKFVYNRKNKKITMKKQNSGHAINIINDEKFVLYPFQSGNPYLFEYLKEVE